MRKNILLVMLGLGIFGPAQADKPKSTKIESIIGKPKLKKSGLFLVVNEEDFTAAKAVRFLQEKIKNYMKKLEQMQMQHEQKMQAEKNDLDQQKTKDPQGFSVKNQIWLKRVADETRVIQDLTQKLENATKDAMEKIWNVFNQALREVSEKYDKPILKESAVAYSQESEDVTKEVLAEVDKKIQVIEIKVIELD